MSRSAAPQIFYKDFHEIGHITLAVTFQNITEQPRYPDDPEAAIFHALSQW